jgi:hypothetical protein
MRIPTHDTAAHHAWYVALRPPEARGRPLVGGQDLALALAAVCGLEGEVADGDVVVCVFGERRWALLSARADREVFGHPNLAVVYVYRLGWVVVTDLRPAIARALGDERGEGDRRAVDEHPDR